MQEIEFGDLLKGLYRIFQYKMHCKKIFRAIELKNIEKNLILENK